MTSEAPSAAIFEHLDHARMNLEAVLHAVLSERVRLLDAALKEAVSALQARNKRLKEVEEFLAKAKRNMDEDKLPFPPSALKFMKAMGISPKIEYSKNVALLQDAMEKLVDADKDEMKKVQALIDKRNQSFEELLNLLQRAVADRVAAVR